MTQYGTAPLQNEIEAVVFGPGFGESIVTHLGDEQWMVIDSCIDAHTKQPAALTYLSSIGVGFDKVKVIVASHWHDDHVRGIAAVARACVNAEVHISAVFSNKEAAAFLAAHSGNATGKLSRGCTELYSVISGSNRVFHAAQRSSVAELSSQGRIVRVTALSPMQAARDEMLLRFAKLLPSEGKPIKDVVSLTPNLEAVVVHVDFGNDALLFGSDLQEHQEHGWSALVADVWCQKRANASLYKVAHHGAASGHSDAIWTTLLGKNPASVVTPFNLGKQRLPSSVDRARLKNATCNAYITSSAGLKPQMDNSQLKRLADVAKGLSPINNGFGAVRMRKRFGAPEWNINLFGDARVLT